MSINPIVYTFETAELLQEFFSYLGPNDLSSCAEVCTNWRIHAEDDSIWAPIAKRIGCLPDSRNTSLKNESLRLRVKDFVLDLKRKVNNFKKCEEIPEDIQEILNEPNAPSINQIQLLNNYCRARDILVMWQVITEHLELSTNFPVDFSSSESTITQAKEFRNWYEENKNKNELKEILTIKDKYGETILHFVLHCVIGNRKIAKLIIEMVDLHSDKLKEILTIKNNGGRTSLHVALENNQTEIAELMMNLGDFELLTAADNAGNTPLNIALKKSKIKIAEFIFQKIDLRAQCLQNDEFKEKCEENFAEKLFTATDNCGNTTLHYVAAKGTKKMFKRIIEKYGLGGLLTATNHSGNTPLHYAVIGGNTRIVEFIIKNYGLKGEFLTATNNDGNTPFHLAIIYQLEEIIKLFLENNDLKSLTIKNISWNTPLHLVLFYYPTVGLEIIKFLIEKADLELLTAENKSGQAAVQVEYFTIRDLIDARMLQLQNHDPMPR